MVVDCPRVLSTTLVFLASLTACGGDEKRVVAPASPSPSVMSETTLTSAAAPETKQVSPSVGVSEDIARACNLHFDDVAKAPKFDFDKSELLPSDQEVLGAIGRCVSTGPLQGRSITLIGRTDPRGTQQYNMALGARRANSVASFLGQLGVAPSQMKVTSRGELEATGTDEATWLIDRRVDIVLGE